MIDKFLKIQIPWGGAFLSNGTSGLESTYDSLRKLCQSYLKSFGPPRLISLSSVKTDYFYALLKMLHCRSTAFIENNYLTILDTFFILLASTLYYYLSCTI